MSNAALLADYLFLRPLIQARLQAEVAELAAAGAVQGIEDLAQAMERSINAPSVYVLWEGDVFDTTEAGRARGGKSQALGQQWTTLLGVRNADQITLDGRNAVAGPLLSKIHKAIAGWAPDGAFRPFQRIQGRRPAYSPNVGLYPLTFEISFNL